MWLFSLFPSTCGPLSPILLVLASRYPLALAVLVVFLALMGFVVFYPQALTVRGILMLPIILRSVGVVKHTFPGLC